MQISGFTLSDCAKRVEQHIGKKVSLVLNEGGMPVGADNFFRILSTEDGDEITVRLCVTEGDWWVRLP